MRTALALVVALLLVGACGGSTPAALPDIRALTCADPAPVAAQPPSTPALAILAGRESAPISGRIVDSGHGRADAEPPITVDGPDRKILASQLRAAAAVACRLRTTNDAQRAGYTLSSVFTEGVGAHWTNWNLVDAPFDPERPSMLLYAPRVGRIQLVGFSYWVRTTAPDGPAGFAGTADHWHRHFGLCFDRTGLLGREAITNARQCDGRWLNGADMWMLHAWIVPGDANAWGTFAALNPALCSKKAPDIARCPGFAP